MMFNNPWGLLALLAIPAILALHFFRSRRQTRRIGGLHLWHDAPTRLPLGRRWDRLMKSFSLMCQLLGALLLALLLAGLDLPDTRTLRHYTVILDDSVSMTARVAGGETPAKRAAALLRGWAPHAGRFTVVAAGAAPRLLVGPFAPREELLKALDDWQPGAPACDLQAATALAGKFAAAGPARQKNEEPNKSQGADAQGATILFVTDDAAAAQTRAGLLQTAGVGRPLANCGFIFADRLRIAAARDRVLVTVKNYNGAAARPELHARANGVEIFKAALALPADGAVQQAFETGAVAEDLEIELTDDALAADNQVVLAPVAIKFVRVARAGLEGAEQAIGAAVHAVPYTLWLPQPEEVDLLLTDNAVAAPPAKARVLCRFADLPTTAPARVATGNELRPEPDAALLTGIGFEGALWPYYPGALGRRLGVELWAGREGLVQRERVNGAEVYTFNLRLLASNLFKQPAWPLLVKNLVELTREQLPGLARANYNAGEIIELNLGESAGACELQRDGKVFARYDQPPRVLSGLPAGTFDLLQKEKNLAHFRVNLIAPGESDLRGVTPREPDLRRLSGGQLRAATMNPTIYYALLLGAIASLAGAWICQDRSR